MIPSAAMWNEFAVKVRFIATEAHCWFVSRRAHLSQQRRRTMLLFHGALTRLSLGEISERRANLGMKVEKRATADLQSVQVSESGTVFPPSGFRRAQ